jgi:nucleotide-binding universal stress UspA family protein
MTFGAWSGRFGGERATPVGVTVQYGAVQGVPAEAIVAQAQQIRADLVVVGTHGRKGLDRLILGSVAESVVRGAHCSVLTVKPRA